MALSSLFGSGGWGDGGGGVVDGVAAHSVYTQGQEVRAPECHGANTDHLKTVRERASHCFTAVDWMDRGRFTVKEGDGVCVCVCVCVCVGDRSMDNSTYFGEAPEKR